MSPVDTKHAPPQPDERQGVLSGWGRTSPVTATLVRPGDSSQVAALLAGEAPARGLIARGAGRSYGDAAQNGDGTVIDMTALAGITALDSRTGEIEVGAGTTFAELLEALAQRGLTLPVVPGTAHLTVGGAIAADVHGKNHPRAGSIARQLRSFALCTPADGEIEVSESEQPELWAATLGGMGLTGVITAATLRTIELRRPIAVADTDKVDTLEEAIELLDADAHSHAIAWLDLMGRGRRFGRAVVTRSREGEQPAGSSRLELKPAQAGVAARLPSGLLRPASVRAYNRMRWLASPRRARERPLAIDAALFPLDAIGAWNRLYGRRGLVQYQCAVPDGEEWTLRCLLEMLRSQRLPMYLATLKRLGPGSGGMLSFPLKGWTLAIDIPARAPGLAAA
ncbi:MAG: decaprenylphospho-beta-D-ribofuranose 2-oxidase, partial [Solirubrobacteraceae bacterium]|nr:decaprenylphospho-beta-D-ribofuranose 2-oxidase [Solirubrobacteraceae bacterium]